jgi:hypothetical protein
VYSPPVVVGIGGIEGSDPFAILLLATHEAGLGIEILAVAGTLAEYSVGHYHSRPMPLAMVAMFQSL